MKKLIKVIIVFLLIWVLAFAWISFASTWWAIVNNDMWKWIWLLQKAVNVIYLILRPFMMIAWKFLSNEFVYGAAFGIDNVLWKLWQVTRTLSNYLIWIVFIWSLFIYFFKSESNFSWKKNMPRILIAAVLINASWFLLAVLIDISTILTMTAWSIWTHFNPWFKKNEHASTMMPIVINPDKEWDFIKIAWADWQKYDACIKDKDNKIQNKPCINFLDWSYKIEWEESKGVEWIDTKSIEWSSVWMLISLFRYMNWSLLNADNTNQGGWTFIMSFMKLFLILLLLIPFLVLSIILVVRVLVLRVVIPLSPFILASLTLWIFDSKIRNKFKDIIALIFQPAYVVFMLSIWFVFIQSIYSMIPGSDETNEQKSKDIMKTLWMTAKPKSSEWDMVSQEINLWKEWASVLTIQTKHEKWSWTNTNSWDWKNILPFFSWIIANLFAALILRTLVFAALKSSSFTRTISERVEWFSKQAAKSARVLPYWHSVTSMWATFKHIQSVPWLKAQSQTTRLQNLGKSKKDWDDD